MILDTALTLSAAVGTGQLLAVGPRAGGDGVLFATLPGATVRVRSSVTRSRFPHGQKIWCDQLIECPSD
jgi:acyl dehydratase